jgi:hypothetical protein
MTHLRNGRNKPRHHQIGRNIELSKYVSPGDHNPLAAMKGYMKEILADSAILSLLIIAPMAFLGPGWRLKNPDGHISAERFRREHVPQAATEARNGKSERDIPILRAFKEDGGERD